MMKALGVAIALGLGLGMAACAPLGAREFDRGVVHYERGDYLFAVDAFDEAIRLAPRSAAAYNNRAVALARIGRLQEAIADYTRALALSRDDAEIHFNRGNAFVAVGNHSAAASDFTRAAQLSPGYARAFYNRGTARWLAGDAEGARADWRYAQQIEADPFVKAVMQRRVALAAAAPGVAVGPPAAPGGAPPPLGALLPPGPVLPPPLVSVTPAPDLAASPVTGPGAMSPGQIEARVLASRAIARHLDGDRAGALADLRAAVMLERDVERRRNIEQLIELLERPR